MEKLLNNYISKDKLNKLKEISSIGTHSGTFHLDEVTSFALLKLSGWSGEIIRTRDQDVLNKLPMLIDVGMEFDPKNMRFDHHQIKDGTISSAGLIWQWLELDLLSFSVFKRASKFIDAVDAQDCGVKQMGPHSIAMVVSGFNSNNQHSKEQEDNFLFAIEMVSKYLFGLLLQDIQVVEAADKIKNAKTIVTNSGAKAIVFDSYCNGWNDYINGDQSSPYKQISRVIWYDDVQNVYKVQVPSLKKGSFELNGEKIKPSDKAVFVHNAGFIAVFNNMEDLIANT